MRPYLLLISTFFIGLALAEKFVAKKKASYTYYRSDIHVYGPNQDTAYDIQLKGAIKSNEGQENRSAKDYSNVILSQGFAEKMRKYSELAS